MDLVFPELILSPNEAASWLLKTCFWKYVSVMWRFHLRCATLLLISRPDLMYRYACVRHNSLQTQVYCTCLAKKTKVTAAAKVFPKLCCTFSCCSACSSWSFSIFYKQNANDCKARICIQVFLAKQFNFCYSVSHKCLQHSAAMHRYYCFYAVWSMKYEVWSMILWHILNFILCTYNKLPLQLHVHPTMYIIRCCKFST